MTTLYGIPNCDTIRKARGWLRAHDIDYRFHNYKIDGVPENALRKWANQVGWETLLNRRGTTWRKLDHADKEKLTGSRAIRLMIEYPGLIKRPVLDVNGRITVGFSEDLYKKITF